MDPAKKYLLVAAVVIVTLIIVAIVARRARDKRKRAPRREGYEVGGPATQRQREAAGDLQAQLTIMGNLGQKFQERVRSLGTDGMEGLRASWEGDPQAVVDVVGALTSTLDNARAAVHKARPSCANYHAVYKGLNGAGASFAGTAESLTAAGRALQQTVAQNPMAGSAGGLSDTGGLLIEMGKRVRALASSVHRLGASLDME